MLLVVFEIEVASFSARTGWRGTRMAERANERRRSILRVCSVGQVFSLKPLISTQDWPGVTQSDGGRGRVTGRGHRAGKYTGSELRHTTLALWHAGTLAHWHTGTQAHWHWYTGTLAVS